MADTTDVVAALKDERWERARELFATMETPDLECKFTVDLSEDGTTYYFSPLTFSVAKDNAEMVRYLLERGVNCNVISVRKSANDNLKFRTALSLAAEKRNVEICRLLLENGADIDHVPVDQNIYLFESVITPWTTVIFSGSKQLLDLFLQHSTDPGAIFNSVFDSVGCYPQFEEFCKVMSIQVLDKIFDGRKVSVDGWYTLLTDVSNSILVSGDLRGRQMLIQFIMNYFTVPPKELKLAAEKLRGKAWFQEDVRIGICNTTMLDYIDREACKFPSLQRICRSVIRRSCDPCWGERMQELGLPRTVQDYVTHPLSRVRTLTESETDAMPHRLFYPLPQ